ncbi:MAG: filamentous hemagglutinin N-terminal domain-containing protein [Spirulina sp. SIO3F2]|nr:filamentous hemagglutinin N-terminal domain-containing protein [Spirulina sp. SIO3F2]
MKSSFVASLTLTTLFAVSPLAVQAQVVSDGTVGTIVNGSQIEGGAIRGSNLLHSFQEFGIPAGMAAYFANPAGITDIIGRVTGGNPSEIFGTLGVNGDANLFLSNPAGFVFGPNAQLDIRGSFIATTDSVWLGNYEFSAMNSDVPPLLTINVRPGLQYGTDPTGSIINEARLEMQLGEEVIFFAQEVRHGGEIVAPGGTVNLVGDRVAVADSAVVDVSNPDGHGGTVHVGGDWQGEGALPTAQRTFVGKDAKILANGGGEGNGGEVVVYAEEMAAFYGGIEARGGAVAGDGGQVEVSGREFLDFRGVVDTLAVNGAAGSLLIDPRNIIIGNSGTNDTQLNDNQILFGEFPNSDFEISATTLAGLNGNVTLQASQDIIFNASVSTNNLLFLDIQAGNEITFNADVAINNGSGGQITATAGNNINVNNSISVPRGEVELTAIQGDINVNSSISAAGGSVSIYANQGDINAQGNTISTDTLFVDTGNILLEAEGDITTGELDTSTLGANAGRIDLISHSGSIDTTAGITNTAGGGTGGNISLLAYEDINIGETRSVNVNENAGSISLKSQNGRIDISQGDIISSSLAGNSNTVTVEAESDIVLGGVINASSNGQSSDITIISNRGSIIGGSVVINSGNLGNRNRSELASRGVSSQLILPTDALETTGGNIKLQAGQNIDLTEVAVITSGRSSGNPLVGAGGKIDFIASDTGSITLDTAYIRSVSEQGVGEDLTFSAGSLTMKNKSAAVLRSEETAQSGNINIIAPEFVQFNNLSGVEAQNRTNEVRGNVTIHPTQRLTLTGGSVVSASTASTSPDGRGGLLDITAQLVEVIGSDPNGLTPSTLTSYSSREGTATAGDAGDIRIRADRVELRDGGNILASSLGVGAGGNIDVEADSILVEGTTNSQFLSSGIAADAYGDGRSGNINLKTKSLTVANGGVISTSTFGSQAGGNIAIQADEMLIQGTSASGQVRSGVYAQSFDAGDGGNVTLNISNLQANDRAKVTVSSDPLASDSQFLIQKSNSWIDALRNSDFRDSDNIPTNFTVGTGSTSGGDAGNLNIHANQTIRLDHQSSIVAETTSGQGGNISLNATDYVLLRRNSQISTTAGGTGEGGNININTGFLVAPPSENSDITANAFEGPGGSVTVTAFAIYGLEFRPQLTELSDITVTSTFNTNGTFAFNPLTLIDPTSDLTVLPQNPDTPDFDSGCQLTESGEQGASFVNVGAGGLNPGPEQVASSAQIPLPWVDVEDVNAESGTPSATGSEAQNPVSGEVVALSGCGLSGG